MKKLLISVRRVVEYQIHGTILTIVLNLLTTNVKRWFCFRQKTGEKEHEIFTFIKNMRRRHIMRGGVFPDNRAGHFDYL